MVVLTLETFRRAAYEFLNISNTLNDGWNIEQINDTVYLHKKDRKLQSCYLEDSKQTLTWEYHILYSLSFSVPVMYFNVSSDSGKKLSVEELKTLLEFSTQEDNQISQTEHPLLRRPFYFLHPCRTTNLIETISNSNNILISWLSVVAPIVKLELNLEYALGIN